mgnify:CR=1 FL=1
MGRGTAREASGGGAETFALTLQIVAPPSAATRLPPPHRKSMGRIPERPLPPESGHSDVIAAWPALLPSLVAPLAALRHRLGLAYDDDCLSIAVTWRRDYQPTGDARRGNTFLFRLEFKNLGV